MNEAEDPQRNAATYPRPFLVGEKQAQENARLIAEGAERILKLHFRANELDGRLHQLYNRVNDHDLRLSILEGKPKTPQGPIAATLGGYPAPIVTCSKYHLQNCHFCDDLVCVDNTSPGAELYRVVKKFQREIEGPADHPRGSIGTDFANALKKIEEAG